MSPSRVSPAASRGWIIPIGGNIADPALLTRFAYLSGGVRARIAILPTASADPRTGAHYQSAFERLGVREARVAPIETRSDAEGAELLEILERADGIFLTGGSQLKLSTTIGGTSTARLLRRRNAAGIHVAGTSAGAAFLCEHMIAFGDEGPTPRIGMVTLAAGLGLTNRVIVDQHFRQRDRLGRLLTALSYNPFAVGLGLDEDTAAFVGPDDAIGVEGSGGVTIVDPSDVEFSSIDTGTRGEPVSLIGVRLHVLLQGATYHLQTRTATATSAIAAKG